MGRGRDAELEPFEQAAEDRRRGAVDSQSRQRLDQAVIEARAGLDDEPEMAGAIRVPALDPDRIERPGMGDRSRARIRRCGVCRHGVRPQRCTGSETSPRSTSIRRTSFFVTLP